MIFRTRGAVAWTITAALPLAFLTIFFAWPVTAMIVKGFTTGGSWDFSNFAEVFQAPRTLRVIGQTLAQAVLGTLVSVLLGVPGAFVFYRIRFRGRAIARALITIPFVLPTVVVGVAFRALLADGGPLGFLELDQSFAAIIAALVFFNYAVVVRTVGGMWEHLDPRAEQAARSLGASSARAFFTVTLPSLGPAIASAASVVFLFCSTSFGVVMVLGGRKYANIESEIYFQTVGLLNLNGAAVLSIVQFVVVGLALIVAARMRSRREVALGLTPAERSAHRAGHGDFAAISMTVATVLLLHILPLGTLLIRSFQSSVGWGLHNYALLSTTGPRSKLTVTVWEALWESARAAALATAIALLVGGLVVLVVSRKPHSRFARRSLSVLDAVFMLPLGISAVTVGFGFLITMHNPLGLSFDLRTSSMLIPIAQAVVAIPLVVRLMLPVLRAIDPRLRQAASMLGASPGRVLATVDWPIAARSAGLAVGFVFAASLGEFGATSFLVRPDTVTLPVVIFQLIGRPGADNLGMAMAASVVLAALTATVMLLAERLRGTSMGEF